MSDTRIENSIRELSIVDLFDKIDNISNSNEDNDKIIDKIKNKVVSLFIINVRKRKEKERKELMYRQYKEFLKNFQKMLEKQTITINKLIDENIDDEAEVYMELKKELLNYSMQMCNLDFLDMSIVLNKKEQRIYKQIQLYNILEKYYSMPDKICLSQVKKDNQINAREMIPCISNWKNYYYLVIGLEKQQEYNKTIMSFFRNKNRQDSQNEFLMKMGNYYVADFQGQFSKSIYCQRKRLKLTQKQLQDRSGVNHTMIAKIEKLKQPTTLETAVKLLSSVNMGMALYPIADKGEINYN